MSNAAAIVAARCASLNPKVQVLADAAALSFNFVAWSESGEATHGRSCRRTGRSPAGGADWLRN
jgi:hypothetical protein